MKRIPLTQGKFALVDDEDFERVSQYKWQTLKRHNSCYAGRTIYKYPRQLAILMHRFIMGFPKSHVDHRDMDGLNNQRFNLRLATKSQNMMNCKPYSLTSSRYKGVSWIKRDKKWRASIKLNGRSITLGHFRSEVKAAYAYDNKARRLFGEYARTNFN